MPYKNIVFVKFKLELLSDFRFTDKLNDEEKLIFMGLLLLAGRTNNSIPNDPIFIKRNLNLCCSEAKIQSSVRQIQTIFPKLIGNSQILKFKNFNKIHNFIGNSEGTPKDFQEKIRVEKSRIDKIITSYIRIKNWDLSNGALLTDTYKRYGRTAKNLAIIAENDENAVGAIQWLSQDFAQKGLNWTLETVIKYYGEYKKKPKIEQGDAWKLK